MRSSRTAACRSRLADPASLALLDGTIVDFVKQGLNEPPLPQPHVKGECGCGESFSSTPARQQPGRAKSLYQTGTSGLRCIAAAACGKVELAAGSRPDH